MTTQYEIIMKSIDVFESRHFSAYKNNLLYLIKKYTIFNRRSKLSKEEISELKRDLPSGDDPKNYCKKFGNQEYKFCLRIDFCGLSSSTLLNTSTRQEDKTNEMNIEIERLFHNLISKRNCIALNKIGIYLKIRFLFAYPYSEMPFSLMKAENERKRPKVNLEKGHNDKSLKVHYDFNDEPGLNEDEFTHSTIKKTQKESLKKLQELINLNKHLKPTLHNKAINTIQVRFTPIPIPFCMLIFNRWSFMDPYIYAQVEGHSQLSYHYPLIQLNLNDHKHHYLNIENHYDYMWHHDLTLKATDCTDFLNNKVTNGLSIIKLPYDITWMRKERMIKEYLKELHKKGRIAKKEFNEEKINRWKVNLKHRFSKTTKLPFDHLGVQRHSLTVIFTDFVEFSKIAERRNIDILAKELDTCFNEFEEICTKYNIVKIKTIGDAFMCVAGLNKEKGKTDKDYIVNAVLASRDMIEFYKARRKTIDNNGIQFKGMRIGINYGDVVLRRKQIEMDIWGHDVNVAQRMEQKSKTNMINVSDKALKLILNNQRIKKSFSVHENGEIKVGDKNVKMYILKY